MKIFLSWSGQTSKNVAAALRDWLPMILQQVEPWLSSDDIQMGERWSNAISNILKEVDLGIICLTKENLNSSWLNFEAGAISKNNNARVCALCIDVAFNELQGPLAQFQAVKLTKEDLYKLIESINELLSKPISNKVLDEIFRITYPIFDERIKDILTAPNNSKPVASEAPTENIIITKLDEILACVKPTSEETENTNKASIPKQIVSGKPKVFVGSSSEGLPVANAIQENLEHDAEVTLWTQHGFNLSATTIESIVDLTYKYDFAILVFTPDDTLNKRGQQYFVGRDNILFELGLFTGALGRARTFLVYDTNSNIHLPSDLNGVTAATYTSRKDGNLLAALAPVCQRIKRAMGTSNSG